MSKLCGRCKEIKAIDDFYNAKRKDGHTTWCKACSLEYRSKYYTENKEKLYDKSRKWRENNRDKLKAARSTPEAKAAQRERKRKWDRQKMKDPIHRLSNNIRGGMHHALKAKKDGRKWEDLVGYTLQDLINHIEPLLNKTMTWDNYGSTWHIDHITPKSWFKYTGPDDPQFKVCWALNNLQPKLKLDNICKGNRFVG